MRKILFRGKPTKDANVHNELKKQMVNGFVLGSLVTGNQPYIFGDITYDEKEDNAHLSWWIPVVAETVGQFTGLTDKNGERIFEGDIISTDLARDFLVVEFKGGAFVFNCNDGEDDYYDHINASHELDNEYKYGQIIGNIHDNTELLS